MNRLQTLALACIVILLCTEYLYWMYAVLHTHIYTFSELNFIKSSSPGALKPLRSNTGSPPAACWGLKWHSSRQNATMSWFVFVFFFVCFILFWRWGREWEWHPSFRTKRKTAMKKRDMKRERRIKDVWWMGRRWQVREGERKKERVVEQ